MIERSTAHSFPHFHRVEIDRPIDRSSMIDEPTAISDVYDALATWNID